MSTAPQSQIMVYGTQWCPDCHRARRMLDEKNFHYQWINIDQDAEGRKFVEQTNKGMRSVPTILFTDGSILVEPSNQQLAQKLELLTRASPS